MARHKAQVERALGKSKKHGDKAYRDAQAAFELNEYAAELARVTVWIGSTGRASG